LIVHTAVNDERFNKTIKHYKDSNLMFYAGVPLTDHNGQKLGTLCVIDNKENSLNTEQTATLKILSNHVIFTMERKAGIKLLAEKQALVDQQQKLLDDASIRLRSFFESSTNFQVLLGKTGEIIDFNKTAANFIKGIHKDDLVRGAMLEPYLAKNFVDTFTEHYYQALQGASSIVEGSTDYDAHGIIWWDAIFEPARDNDENIIGISYIIRNTTERKQKEQKIVKQNESLLSLAHIQAHEFRAPLTTIMGIMNLIKEDNSPDEYDEYFNMLNRLY
jgi:PAS domain S-box-containing protein